MARNAFRVGLRQDTPLPLSPLSTGGRATLLAGMPPGTAGVTQELDPNDILEVQDMAAAIARAEMMLATPAPPRRGFDGRADIFETLGRRATDDTAGPATPAPPYASHASHAPHASHASHAPPAAPRYVTMSTSGASGAEDDAFYHPVGRMRSLADVTLDGYRPEPTLLVRAASRRKRFSWILAAVLLPLLVLAAVAGFAGTEPKPSPVNAGTTLSLTSRAPTAAAAGRNPLATSSAITKAPRVTVAADHGSAPPVFDVNSLPPARDRR